MTTLEKYTDYEGLIIAWHTVDDLVSFTVCDRNLERLTSKSWDIASDAMKWADVYEGMIK